MSITKGRKDMKYFPFGDWMSCQRFRGDSSLSWGSFTINPSVRRKEVAEGESSGMVRPESTQQRNGSVGRNEVYPKTNDGQPRGKPNNDQQMHEDWSSKSTLGIWSSNKLMSSL